jgi:tetratricopeptide (TPR) repeat protein
MDEAYTYFNKLGKKELIRAMLKRLATTYFEQGKFEQCIQTYRRLIAEDPQSSNAPEYQNEIILAYQKIGRKRETLAEIDRLLKTYGKNSAWARANSADQDSVKDANDYVEKNLRTVAINFHNDAKKLGTGRGAKESYALAYRAYTVYLREFPTSKYSYDIRYAFGELLYKVKKFDEAYSQYMTVVSIDEKGKHSKFCAESAIFAADEMTKKEKKEGRGAPKATSKTQQVPFTEWEKNLLAACDQFSRIFKDDKKTRNIIYKSAYLLYNHNDFKQASDRFRIVIGMNPKSREAEQAANLILDSFNLVEDWNNLKDVSKAFYDQDGLGSSAFKKEVYKVYERASFKLIEINFAKDKNEIKAAEGYLAFFAEFPKSDVADLALNNASVYFHNQKKVEREMETRHTLIDTFPKSKFMKDQVAALGYNYESIADFETAANWYEKLFSMDKEHTDAKDAIYSASLFRRAKGEWQRAIKDYQQFITTFGDDDKVAAIRLEIGQIYEENDKLSEASKVYYTYFTRAPEGATLDQIFYARMHYGVALETLGQTSKANRHWDDTLKAYEKALADGGEMEITVEFIAEIMFKKAKPTIDQYTERRIDGPATKVSKKKEKEILLDQLGGKARALQEVEKIFIEIITTGAGEWGLACLVELGKAYENMGETLKTSYIPPYLTEDQKGIYRMQLEDKIFPQTEKAVTAYSEALKKSFELNLYNDNTAHAIRRLGDLRPADFHELGEELITPRFTSRTVNELPFEENP